MRGINSEFLIKRAGKQASRTAQSRRSTMEPVMCRLATYAQVTVYMPAFCLAWRAPVYASGAVKLLWLSLQHPSPRQLCYNSSSTLSDRENGRAVDNAREAGNVGTIIGEQNIKLPIRSATPTTRLAVSESPSYIHVGLEFERT